MPSSVIFTVHYDPSSLILRVTFVSGVIYEYKNVPEEVYAAFKSSDAKGIYLNKYIKGKYEFEKVNPSSAR